jgi:hypothetical protein
MGSNFCFLGCHQAVLPNYMVMIHIYASSLQSIFSTPRSFHMLHPLPAPTTFSDHEAYQRRGRSRQVSHATRAGKPPEEWRTPGAMSLPMQVIEPLLKPKGVEVTPDKGSWLGVRDSLVTEGNLMNEQNLFEQHWSVIEDLVQHVKLKYEDCPIFEGEDATDDGKVRTPSRPCFVSLLISSGSQHMINQCTSALLSVLMLPSPSVKGVSHNCLLPVPNSPTELVKVEGQPSICTPLRIPIISG